MSLLVKKQEVTTFNIDNFNAIKKYFQNSSIEVKNLDFAEAVSSAQKDDFVYFDPPYDLFSSKKNFTGYNSNGFGKDEQIRLRDTVVKLTKKGVKVMLSNHNTLFINKLYKDFNIRTVSVKRLLSSQVKGRGEVEEVIITNY